MTKFYTFLLFPILLLTACDHTKSATKPKEAPKVVQQKTDTVYINRTADSLQNTEFYIQERLPEWIVRSGRIKSMVINERYKVENRLNPLYLEDDFNGDGALDIVLPVFEIKTNKKGFAIIHGGTEEVFIVGAGQLVENALSDNQDYIDIWRINRNKVNEPGVEEPKTLILDVHSIEIAKSELGGGLIYWNGKAYAYFHQTC